jgi:PKD repeat protein
MSKLRSPRGLLAATLVLILPLALMHCNNDDNNDNPAAPQGSGSLSVSISATPTSGRAPLDVGFASNVTGGKGNYVYSWSFGDGSASSEANPQVRFTNGGIYDVKLHVVSGNESATSSALTVRVDGDVRVSCFVDPEEGSAPHTVNFRADAIGGNGQLGYLWRFGDGATSAAQEAQHTYGAVGTYLATLTVTSGAATGTCADEIHVFGALVPVCKATPQGNAAVKFNVVPNYCFHNGCTYSWDFGDGSLPDGIERPLHHYGAPGTYTATATVKTGAAVGSCQITVNAN